VVDDNAITGTVYSLNDWILDSFNLNNGVINSPPYYYIALDFSDNEFDPEIKVSVVCGNRSPVKLYIDADKILIIEIGNSSEMTIRQKHGYMVYEQVVDLSGLTLQVV
jgi:hypothetical protein